jgi:hypothetical protein
VTLDLEQIEWMTMVHPLAMCHPSIAALKRMATLIVDEMQREGHLMATKLNELNQLYENRFQQNNRTLWCSGCRRCTGWRRRWFRYQTVDTEHFVILFTTLYMLTASCRLFAVSN